MKFLIVKIASNIQLAQKGIILSSTLEQYSKDHPMVIEANTEREAILKYKEASKKIKPLTVSKKELKREELLKSMKVLDALATIYSS